MRKLVLLLFLLTAPAWAFNCNSAGSGNWNVPGTWSNCGGSTPGSGDTATINNGHTVTIPANVTIGTSGATGTAAITVNSGGTLTLNPAVTLTLRGDLQYQKSTTVNLNGNVNFDNPAGTKYVIKTLNAGTAGVPTLNVVGAPGDYITLNTTGTVGSSTNLALDGSATSTNLNIRYAKLLNCGGTSATRCVDFLQGAAGADCNIQDALFDADGEVSCRATGNANWTLDINRISFVDVLGANAMRFDNTTAKSGGSRTIYNVTIEGGSGIGKAQILAVDVKVGDTATATAGIVGYNVSITSLGSRGQYQYSFRALDVGCSSGQGLTLGNKNSLTIDSVISFSNCDNPHYMSESTDQGLNPNVYSNNICDGNGFTHTDGGDFLISGSGPATLANNLLINDCGTLVTANNASAAMTMKNNTLYANRSAVIGETTGGATQLAVFRNNLIVSPVGNGKGLTADTGFLRQSSFSIDYNAFWGMPGSGDPGAPSCTNPCNLPNGTLGVAVSYVGLPAKSIVASSTATAGTNTTTVVCSTCNFTTAGVIAGDFVQNVTRSNNYARISSVDSATQVTLAAAITGQTSGDSFKIQSSWSATAGDVYGATADFGTHDLHADAQFQDSTRTLAGFDSSNGGPGTFAHLVAEMLKLNGWDSSGAAASYNPNYCVANILSYLRAGFTPQNAALKAAGAPADGSPDIGALPVASPGQRHRSSVTWR